MAILASAWGQEFELVAPPSVELNAGVAVVTVLGPLTHHGEWWCCGDTYDSIELRVAEALKSSASTVVLRFDSPGGDVNGCFECSKRLRAIAEASGKRLIAFVDETALSGAYALACACDSIYLPPSGSVGSIGVITMVEDATAADAQAGYKYTAFVSGARKADGCPHVSLSPEGAAEIQRQVDGWALMFATLVAESRGVAVAEIQRLEAAVFQGADALRVRLADGILSWDSLLALLASGQQIPAQASAAPEPAGTTSGTTEKPAMKKYDMALSALRKLAEGGDDGAKLAVAMLEAEEKKEEGSVQEPSEPEEGGGPEKEEEDAPAKARAAASSSLPAAQARATTAAIVPPAPVSPVAAITALEARVHAMEEEKRLLAEASERATLIAGRVMSDETRRWLEDPRTTLVEVRACCRGLPLAAYQHLAAAAMVQPTRGADQVGDPGRRRNRLPPDQAAELDRRMGLAPKAMGTRVVGNKLVLSVATDEQAKSRLDELKTQNGGA